MANLAINHRLKSQRNTGITKSCQVMRPDLNSQVSEKPGAVQGSIAALTRPLIEIPYNEEIVSFEVNVKNNFTVIAVDLN